tara:strand:+ start:283 stop:915 length:633 start_codon:yes stop_codon:yes gene_type:complete
MKLQDPTLEECIRRIDQRLKTTMVNEVITHHLSGKYAQAKTWEAFVGASENDASQQTQAGTKIIQSGINDCIAYIIKEENLPMTKSGIGKGMDLRYVGNGQDLPIEVKCSQGKDNGGQGACIGNLKVLDSKCELTLVFRFKIKTDRIVEWQTVTIDNSARKWTEYNDQSGSSNFSSLKCKTEFDLQDITVYSGSIKPNTTWVKFVKESVC